MEEDNARGSSRRFPEAYILRPGTFPAGKRGESQRNLREDALRPHNGTIYLLGDPAGDKLYIVAICISPDDLNAISGGGSIANP
jgi:hypothetical protein